MYISSVVWHFPQTSYTWYNTTHTHFGDLYLVFASISVQKRPFEPLKEHVEKCRLNRTLGWLSVQSRPPLAGGCEAAAPSERARPCGTHAAEVLGQQLLQGLADGGALGDDALAVRVPRARGVGQQRRAADYRFQPLLQGRPHFLFVHYKRIQDN